MAVVTAAAATSAASSALALLGLRHGQALGKVFDQEAATVLLAPTEDRAGFWVGAGNLVHHRGHLYVVARYRDDGDSRTALEKGVRGRELAVLRMNEDGATWTKIHSWTKDALSLPDPHAHGQVISIEGSQLVATPDRVFLFVSSEKKRAYPAAVAEFQKPDTGVWSIDVFDAPSIEALDPRHAQSGIRPFLRSDDPEHLHVKDPVYVAPTAAGGVGCLVVCIHSFAWSEGHSGHVRIRLDADGGVVTTGPVVTSTFPRGTTWDVATARITGSVPAAVLAPLATIDGSGGGAGDGTATVFLYDGAESFREQPQNARAKARPRGYCCEELGGALVGHLDGPLARLSPYLPLMVSPHGTGCSRYHSICVLPNEVIGIWQQSSSTGAQPLVWHRVPLPSVH